MNRSVAPKRASKPTKSPLSHQHRKISNNKMGKLVRTKKRLMLEIPSPAQIDEISSTSGQKTSFGLKTDTVSFSHPLPTLEASDHPLLTKPALSSADQMFAIIDVNGAQHKVTKDDAIMVNHLKDVEVGERLAFEHVYLLAGRDFTVLGKPWVPKVQVIATVEEHTLLAPQLTWKYKRRTGYRRVQRSRDHVTVLRIDDLIVEDKELIPDVQPLQTLQLNAMRPTQQQIQENSV